MSPSISLASVMFLCCLHLCIPSSCTTLSAQGLLPDSLAAVAARAEARACQQAGELDEALSAWGRALRLGGEDTSAREARCEILRRQQRLPEALAELDQAMPAAACFLERAFLRALCGQAEAAVADFQSAHELRGDVYGALYLRIWSDEVTSLRPFASEPGWQGSLARFGLGICSADELVRTARESAVQSMRSERLCEAYACLGLVAERAGAWRQAEAHYRACLQTGVERFIEYRWARDRLAQGFPDG